MERGKLKIFLRLITHINTLLFVGLVAGLLFSIQLSQAINEDDITVGDDLPEEGVPVGCELGKWYVYEKEEVNKFSNTCYGSDCNGNQTEEICSPGGEAATVHFQCMECPCSTCPFNSGTCWKMKYCSKTVVTYVCEPKRVPCDEGGASSQPSGNSYTDPGCKPETKWVDCMPVPYA